MVADALEVGDDVRREDHGHAGLRDDLHHRLQELAPRERVERGDRLVEQQQLGPLRERERERDLRLLAAGELADLLPEREPELLDARVRERVVPGRVELAAERQRLGDREALVERMVLRDEADARQHRPAPPRVAGDRTRRISPADGLLSPTASCRSVVLPAPFGPTSAVTEPAGTSSVQSRSAQFAP